MRDTNYDKETLNGLINQMNFPYTLVSTTDDPAELRRRLGFVRRVKAALDRTEPQIESKIDIAKLYLSAQRLRSDVDNLLGYLGGTLATAGDYAYDLKRFAPVVNDAAKREAGAAFSSRLWVSIHSPLTDEEKSYLGKVLDAPIRTSKQYAVAYPGDNTDNVNPIPHLGEGTWTPDIADAWAAASRVPSAALTYRAGVVAEPLVARLRERVDGVVYVDVTQLEPIEQAEVADNLATEIEANPSNPRVAITRAFI